MNARERVLAALNHEEPDRIPFDLNGTVCSGIHATAYRRLLSYLGLEEREISVHDPVQQLAWVDEEMLQKLKVDTRLS